MQLNEAIKSIITQTGVDRVTFGISEKGKPIVFCEQLIQTHHGVVKSVFNAVGDSHEDALENLIKDVKHCGELQTKILKIKDN